MNSNLAFESVSCLAISLAVYSALIVVAVAPARRMPWNTVANAELLGESSADHVADADAARGERARRTHRSGDQLAVGGLVAATSRR